MRIVSLKEIQSVVDIPKAIDAVKLGLIAVSKGNVAQPQPLQMLFNDALNDLIGDCHVKAASAAEAPYFVIKIASGFYRNADRGLPVNSGLVMVMSGQSGLPVAILQDEGWLTQIRTAAAGALAAQLKPVGKDATLGIIGAGTQAQLQARVVTAHLGLSRVVVFGRSREKVITLCNRLGDAGIDANPAETVREVCAASDIVVTTTPSTTPVITDMDISSAVHIVALGADSTGKIEVAPDVMAGADIIVTDSHAQCLHHGDFGSAVRANLVSENADVSFCDLLAGKLATVDFASANLSVVDLTGLGAQDLALASLVVEGLGGNVSGA